MKITDYQDKEIRFNEENALKYIDHLTAFIQERVKIANAKGMVVGISGGIDSALVFALAKKALGNNVKGYIMPIDSMSFDMPHIKKLESNLESEFEVVDLSSTFQTIKLALNVKDNLSIANIKPRLRMTTLYAKAQELNYLVAGTDNYDEFFIGYFTKFGDGGADLLPISHLTKSEVRFLAKLLNVPSEILEKKPSAGLWEGQSDEDELGFTYADLDFYLRHLDSRDVIEKHLDADVIAKIERRHALSQHKRDGAYRPLAPINLD
ncbi:NAD(+) synthase [Mycoplasma sp. Ms02]|uniref:NAD(+) synthase n=1 Tax=Mycoplasma sp. Ms02 TaxID=353851 RepID=UPI001C894DD4|nr:NAD(+) synthase [Mycoplasma sp. Ms02]QZE12513.1 NAD(+) synthase [Mycoplasma sp. Ms02]